MMIARATAFVTPFKEQGVAYCAGGDYQIDMKLDELSMLDHMGSEFESARTHTDS